MKVLLCCIGKGENPYIREFVEYYKVIGFDNIWLYDNNDPDGEHFEDVIGDYIDSGFVVLKDYRGRKTCQLQAYNECYAEVGKDYDWIAFFDCDEFLVLEKKKNIHHELALSKFKGFDAIHVNWKNYGDGGMLFNDGRKLRNRIAKPVMPLTFCKSYSFPENNHVKSIVRTGISSVLFGEKTWSHTPEGLNKCCNGVGEAVNPNSPFCPFNFEEMHLDHYSTKTTGEYVEKLKKGFPDRVVGGAEFYSMMVDLYFKINDKTPEKIAIFEKELGIKVPTKRKDVQIFMLCYSPKDYGFIDNDIITPLQCGAAISGYDTCPLKDNTGDNISDKNHLYVENTGTYWIWKHVHDAKYIGQTQYGRRLKISENDDFDAIFADHDIIVAKPYHYEKFDDPSQIINGGAGWIPAKTVEEGYAYSHCLRDLQMLERIVKQAFPDYSEDWDKYIKRGNDLIYSNGFVMKSEMFDEYCKFLFTCLNIWELTMEIKKPSDIYVHVMRNLFSGGYTRPEFKNPFQVSTGAIDWQTEMFGFFAERLLTLFVFHNCKNIFYTDYEKTEDKPL